METNASLRLSRRWWPPEVEAQVVAHDSRKERGDGVGSIDAPVLVNVKGPRVDRGPRRDPERIDGIPRGGLQHDFGDVTASVQDRDAQAIILKFPGIPVLEFVRHGFFDGSGVALCLARRQQETDKNKRVATIWAGRQHANIVAHPRCRSHYIARRSSRHMEPQ